MNTLISTGTYDFPIFNCIMYYLLAWNYKSCFTEGCSPGYYLLGDACKQCSSHCKDRCANGTGACEECKKGYYMDRRGNCQSCPQQCSRCSDEDEVVCNECKTGYWSDGCSIKCFEGCTFDICHRTEGYCLKGCKEGFSNNLCNERMSTRLKGGGVNKLHKEIAFSDFSHL